MPWKVLEISMEKPFEIIDFSIHEDSRGKLIPYEFSSLPFSPKRFFYTTVNVAGTIRGEHGHHVCEQVIFSLKGSILVKIRNRSFEATYTLEPNGKALYIPAGTWASQTFSVGSEIMGCLASHPYDESDVFKTFD